MRRALPVIALAFALSLGVLALPRRAARTTTPGQPVPAPGLDAADFPLGELLEGDAPLEQVDLNTLPGHTVHGLTDGIPAPEGFTVDFKHYPSAEALRTFLDELAAAYPDLAEVMELGTSWQGRPIRAIRITNERSPGELRDRPAMYIDGQHHARELISSQVPLYTAWYLLHFYGQDPFVTHLVDTRALFVVPSVNPDGNDIVLKDYQSTRKTANPTCCDDDTDNQGRPAPDGRVDEDYSVGYGYGTHDLYLYHFNQAWADAHPQDPFADGWQQEQASTRESLGRHTGALGGPVSPVARLDMDGDGQQDEDEVGGVDPNRNYDAHWEAGDQNVGSEIFRGPEVWSEPEVKAVRDFTQELGRLATGLFYHSGTDLILHPWAFSPEADLADVAWFEMIGRKGSQLTEVNGFQGSPHTWTARGLYSAAGSSMDWLYDQRGVLSWAPEVYGGSSRTTVKRLGTTGTYTVGTALGFGFNPRPEEILASTDRWNRFALYVLAATPNVELNGLAMRDGGLDVKVGNDGLITVDTRVEVRLGDEVLVDQTVPLSSASGGRVVTVPPDVMPQVNATGLTLRLTAHLPVGTRPHDVEVAEYRFDLVNGQPVLSAGQARPFVDLSARFDGWWAPEHFDTPGVYHVPADRPIDVPPPGGTPTPATPETPEMPTATPPAPTPEPAPGLILPWAERP
jgi:hypothetical protein